VGVSLPRSTRAGWPERGGIDARELTAAIAIPLFRFGFEAKSRFAHERIEMAADPSSGPPRQWARPDADLREEVA
jgi:hypothetical protein